MAAEQSGRVAERTAQQNLQMQQEVRLGERFSKGVEQLSSTSCGVRVGAVYTLARIARESKTDHWPIVELLCAFLRDQRPIGQQGGSTAAPSEDFKAIATFIRTRRIAYEEPGQTIDLSSTDLHGLNFDGAELTGSNFGGSGLEGTSFRYAKMNGTSLVNAVATGSIFSGADLEGSFLNGAEFTGSQMDGVDLKNARITNAVFKSVIGPIRNITTEQKQSAMNWTVVNTRK
jgi:hypothetical protein